MKVRMSISVDKDIKEKADSLFKTLGLDFSTAVNIFLHQCILIGDIPLRREYEIENAILEAETIARDPDAEGYESIEKLKEELLK